jgi:hypothetical protein
MARFSRAAGGYCPALPDPLGLGNFQHAFWVLKIRHGAAFFVSACASDPASVYFVAQTGKHLLGLNFTAFDPKQSSISTFKRAILNLALDRGTGAVSVRHWRAAGPQETLLPSLFKGRRRFLLVIGWPNGQKWP